MSVAVDNLVFTGAGNVTGAGTGKAIGFAITRAGQPVAAFPAPGRV
jgi:hypothetical protein